MPNKREETLPWSVGGSASVLSLCQVFLLIRKRIDRRGWNDPRTERDFYRNRDVESMGRRASAAIRKTKEKEMESLDVAAARRNCEFRADMRVARSQSPPPGSAAECMHRPYYLLPSAARRNEVELRLFALWIVKFRRVSTADGHRSTLSFTTAGLSSSRGTLPLNRDNCSHQCCVQNLEGTCSPGLCLFENRGKHFERRGRHFPSRHRHPFVPFLFFESKKGDFSKASTRRRVNIVLIILSVLIGRIKWKRVGGKYSLAILRALSEACYVYHLFMGSSKDWKSS